MNGWSDTELYQFKGYKENIFEYLETNFNDIPSGGYEFKASNSNWSLELSNFILYRSNSKISNSFFSISL